MSILFRKYNTVTSDEFVDGIKSSELGSSIELVSATGSIIHDVEAAEQLNLYVDTRMPEVRVLFTTNFANITTVTGPQTHEGVSLVAGDVAAFAGQTTGSENDLWLVGATGDNWQRAPLQPRRGMRLHVREETFADRQFVVTVTADRSSTGMSLRRIDGTLVARAGVDANVNLGTALADLLRMPRMYLVIPTLSAIRTYTLPSTVDLIDGAEIIAQFGATPNNQISFVPNNTGAGETINGLTSYAFTATPYRRLHLIYSGGDWYAS
jgi:hypothetical protein